MTTPHATIARLGSQVMLARCVGVVAEIGIADLVAATPQTPDALAKTCGVHPEALMRILRFLASHEIFRADDQGRIHNTPLSETFRADVPGSLRDAVRQSWQDVIWDTYRQLPHTLKTGEPAFTKAFGLDFFDYLAQHQEIGARFDKSMALQSAPENAAIAATYPFADANVVVDVGGGRGGLMAAILNAHPAVRGILYDQPHVLVDAENLYVKPVMDRCTLATGNFFESVVPGGDLYVLKRILHDWTDDQAITILKACRAVLGDARKLLVIDAVIKPGNDPDPNKMLDVGIMALTPGRERTAEDFERIFTAAGLKLTSILPPPAPSALSMVEGVRV